MKENIEEIPEIGSVVFVKSKRAKNLRISLRPFGGVRVTMPNLMTYRAARKFVMLKKDWIIKNLATMKNKEVGRTVFDENSDFSTNLHDLIIDRREEEKSKASLSAHKINVVIPLNVDIYKEEVQEFIRKSIEESWRKEAKSILPRRTQVLAQTHGFEYNKVTIRNTVSRWGSCSYQNNINFSLHLMRLPAELQDYVILHELAHTKEKNHQPPFWALLDSVTNGNARKLDREIKKYTTRIY